MARRAILSLLSPVGATFRIVSPVGATSRIKSPEGLTYSNLRAQESAQMTKKSRNQKIADP